MNVRFLFALVLMLCAQYADAQTANDFLNSGSLKYEQEDYKVAIQDFTKLIALRPNDAIAYNNRGTAKMDLEDYRGAIQDFTTAIKLKPNYAKAYCNRGTVKLNLKEYKSALTDLNQAIKLDKKYGKAYNNRGLVNFFMGNKSATCLDFSKVGEYGNDKAYDNIQRYCN